MDDFKVHIDEHSLTFSKEDVQCLDAIALDDSTAHIIQKGQGYKANVVPNASNPKEMVVIVNGNRYAITIADGYDQMVEKMGLLSAASQKINEVKAPMPGLIIGIKVKVGQEIKKDDQLLVLSAMKMENIILAPGEGIVKAIAAKEGDAVEKGQVIIEME